MKRTSDFDKLAIDFYLKYYEECLKINGNKYTYSHNEAEIEVSGDVCFNLKLKYGEKRSLFGSIIEDEEEFLLLEKSLEKLRYLPMNISIMPKTGSLNNIKKAIGNDRFDIFVWLINQYYKGLEVLILNAGAQNMYIGNRKILKEFLDSYKDVYDYCKDIYGIDEGVVNKLLRFGEKTIVEKEDYYQYIKLALEFWEKRMEQSVIKQQISDCEKNEYEAAINTIYTIINSSHVETAVSITKAEKERVSYREEEIPDYACIYG